jgi:hypothetical protein
MKSLGSYDSGNQMLVEQCNKIDVNTVVSEVNDKIKPLLIKNVIQAEGFDLELTTSKTAFRGTRYWFKCPLCKQRVGVVYQHPMSEVIGCRDCLNLKYKSQRYKGMVENKL